MQNPLAGGTAEHGAKRCSLGCCGRDTAGWSGSAGRPGHAPEFLDNKRWSVTASRANTRRRAGARDRVR